MSKISYRPDLTPERSYESRGSTINTYRKTDSQASQKEPTKLEELEALVDDIKAYDVIIPTKLKPLCNTIVSAIEFIYYYVDPEKIKNNGKQQIQAEIKNPSITDSDDSESPDDENVTKESILSKYQPSFIIRIKEPNLVDQIEYDFYNNLLDLAKHHSLKYREQLNDYYISIITVLKATDGVTFNTIAKEYKYPPLKFSNPNNQHLSDHIIRSQIVRDQKTRMGKKLFNNAETMNIVKACESSKELLKKYVKEEFEKDKDEMAFFKNIALQDSINMYKEKIDIGLMEFYKYLTASNALLKECLEMSSNEMRSKSILINEEGVTL